MKFLQLLWIIGWMVLLFIFTCTSNLEALLYHQVIHFHWNSHPQYSDLWFTKDAHFNDPYYLFIKFGHFAGFSILCWLLSLHLKVFHASVCSCLYAISTEILQLYFSRDGRFIDMGIDMLGVILMSFLLMSLHEYRKQLKSMPLK